jgi:hypothetical protein
MKDPAQYFMSLLALLTPYQECTDLIYDSSGQLVSYEQSFNNYMETISMTDPCRHAWVSSIVRNMKAIDEGRDQQKKDRLERERLCREQNLVPEESVALGPYDYLPETDVVDVTLADKEFSPELLNSLPKFGPVSRNRRIQTIVSEMENDSHLSVSSNNSLPSMNTTYTCFGPQDQITVNAQCEAFKRLLKNERELLYTPQEHGTGGSTPNSLEFICNKHTLDDDQRNAVYLICTQIVKKELFRQGKIDQPSQMSFYLGGAGGSGKSGVVNTITEYLTNVGLRHALRLTAFTGTSSLFYKLYFIY